MKKLSVFFLIFAILLSGCGKKLTTPAPSPEASPTEGVQLADKITDTAYAGRVTEITDSAITIIMDEKVSETFNLNERAKNDIRVLEVTVDKRVIVNFKSAQDREITGIEVIKSE